MPIVNRTSELSTFSFVRCRKERNLWELLIEEKADNLKNEEKQEDDKKAHY